MGRVEATRNHLLSVSGGPGGCTECHVASGPSSATRQIAAAYVMHSIEYVRRGATDRSYTRFAHKPRILLGD